MSSVKLLLHHNKAQLPGFLEIDPEKTTPSELISSALKQAKLTGAPDTYKYFVSSYLKDIRTLDSDAKDIKDLELTPLSTIFIMATDGNKPRRRKKQEKEVEIDIGSGDEVEMELEDVIKALEKTSATKKRTAIIKFAASNGEKLLETKGFTDCSKETLVVLLKDDTFAATESSILDAVLGWAKKKAKKDDDLKKVLTKDILTLVRLPLLPTSDVATKIVPLGVLEMQQTLDLFSYTGSLQAARDKDKDAKAPALPKSISDYSNKARTPVRKPTKWGQFCASPRITLSNNNLTATHESSSGHSWVLSEDTVSKGRKEWKCRIDALQYNNWVMFGVCHTLPTSSNSYTSPGTWGLASSGQVYTNGSSSSSGKYDQYYIQGGNVTCVLDLNALTFTITVVESGYSYSFSGLPSGHTWYFHINLHGSNDQVTLIP